MPDFLWWIGGIVGILIVGYLIINGKKNSDPLNRKCAAEICIYLTETKEPSVEEVFEIFMRNARFQSQANHVISMVPALLMNSGVPKDAAMSVVPFLRLAVALIPR